MKRDLIPADKAEEIAATRDIVRLIKALPVWAKTPAAMGHLADILVQQIEASGWGHLDQAQSASEFLADAATVLGEMESQPQYGLDDSAVDAARRAGL